MTEKPTPSFQNRILAQLSPRDYRLLKPHLALVRLPFRKRLEARDRRIGGVFFIERGFASVVANGKSTRNIEIGLIGREGMTGLAVVLGADHSPYETYIQNAGEGWCVPSDHLRRCMEKSASLRGALLLNAHAFTLQMANTAVANSRHKIEERLARWLLMAHDRIDGDELALTHEFLALMLGVRRPGVTVALNFFERKGLIQAERGRIAIVDRVGLEQASKGAYQIQPGHPSK